MFFARCLVFFTTFDNGMNLAHLFIPKFRFVATLKPFVKTRSEHIRIATGELQFRSLSAPSFHGRFYFGNYSCSNISRQHVFSGRLQKYVKVRFIGFAVYKQTLFLIKRWIYVISRRKFPTLNQYMFYKCL